MRDQLEALSELATIDRGFRQCNAELEELNTRLRELREDVGRIRELLDREKQQLAEIEQMRSQSLIEAEALLERIHRSTERGYVARNTRERDAAAREVELLRKERQERLQRASELETGIVDVRASIERHVQDFEKLTAVLAQEEEHVRSRSAAIEAQRAEITKVRAEVAKKIRADVLRKYESVRARKGDAIAEAHGGICHGCHVALPPQQFAKLVATFEVMQCPSCFRILIVRSPSVAGASS